MLNCLEAPVECTSLPKKMDFWSKRWAELTASERLRFKERDGEKSENIPMTDSRRARLVRRHMKVINSEV